MDSAVAKNRIRALPGVVYAMGFIGSAAYFFQQASGLPELILAILKSAVWPALMAYQIFNVLNA